LRVEVFEVRCRTALSRSGIYGVDYSLNPYFGCEHSCVYCYVPRMMPHRLAGRVWGGFVEVKVNMPRVLSKELAKIRRGRVLVSSITDPYQPTERRYGLTRSCLELLVKRGLQVVVLTKSTLFLRDLDVMELGDVELGVTITTLRAHRELEPRSPPPVERLRALREASERGIKTFLFLGPLIPGLVDDDVEGILGMAKEAGVQYVIIDKLNLKGDVEEAVSRALSRELSQIFRAKLSSYKWLSEVKARIVELCRELNLPYDFCF